MASVTNFEFRIVSCNGRPPPKLSFHSCSLVRNKFYIFGGMDDKKNVHNEMFCFEPSTDLWSEVKCFHNEVEKKPTQFKALAINEVPRLSHHTATVLEDRYILFIGGWTGHKRTSDVFYFDTCKSVWFQIQVKGDIPVGLSSHTATSVGDKEVIIVGREGGTHTQRRTGDSFYFNAETGEYRQAFIHVSSRSGHSANLVKSSIGKDYKLLVQGGRKGHEYEFIGSWRRKPELKAELEKDKISSLLKKWVVCEEPKSRQHSVSVELNERYLLFYGGETWSGVRNNITNETYLLDCQKMRWYCPPHSQNIGPCVTGHAMGILEGKVYVFGGLLEGKCSNNVWLVEL